MRASLGRFLCLAAFLAVAAGAGAIAQSEVGTAQGQPSIGIDADPSGNTATSLGAIDPCISVNKGDTFQVDIYIKDVVNLLGWEMYFHYEPSIVSITDRDVKMFLAATPGSDVLDASEGLPDIDNLHRLAAVDLALPHAPDSGSGVLARLTLQAVGSGLSPIDVAGVDANGDGTIDIGPLLTDDQGRQIGPRGPEGFFAGTITSATVAVDTACEDTTPIATPMPTQTTSSSSPSPVVPATIGPETPATSPTSGTAGSATPGASPTQPPASATAVDSEPNDDGESAWTSGPAIIGYVAGGLGALLLAAIGVLALKRSRV